MNRHYLTEEEKRHIREHLPHTTYKQIGTELGRNPDTVRFFAKANGISNNKEAAQEAIREGGSRGRENRPKDWRERLSKTRKEMFRKERLREAYGLSRKTIYKIDKYPRRLRNLRHNLKSVSKYKMQDCRHYDGDPYVAYYDSDTRRRKDEAYLAEKYGIKFLPLDE